MKGTKKVLARILVLMAIAAFAGLIVSCGPKEEKGNTEKNISEVQIENGNNSETEISDNIDNISALSDSSTETTADTPAPSLEAAPTDTISVQPQADSQEEMNTADDPGNGRVVGGPWASEGEEGLSASNGHVVVIDPGHQAKGDSSPEPVGPGSSETKARVSSGTSGCVSGLDEYELNLQVSQLLEKELENRGYTVYMTRETHEVNISNKERAEYASSVGGEVLIRIHANGSENSSVSGALCMAPSDANPYVSSLAASSQYLAQCIIDNYCEVTGFNNQGVYITDDMSGINWSTMPVTIVEMGYMTNESDDSKMADSGFESTMVMGIANGIDQYFG